MYVEGNRLLGGNYDIDSNGNANSQGVTINERKMKCLSLSINVIPWLLSL